MRRQQKNKKGKEKISENLIVEEKKNKLRFF